MQSSTELESLTDALSGRRLGWIDYGVAFLILLLSIVAAKILRIAVKRALARGRTDELLGDLIGRIVQYVAVTFGVVYALDQVGIAIGPVLGALGVIGIALAFALQDVLENFVAGVILQLQRPFGAGDEIDVADHSGTIVRVETRTITLETPDGQIVRIPSAEVIKNPITNFTEQGQRRTTIDVGVAYGTDLEAAVEVALTAMSTVAGVSDTPQPQVLVHTFGASSIDLAVRYWHEPTIAATWQTRHEVAVAVNHAFAENGIKIPFPQRVVHVAPGALDVGPESTAAD